MRTLFCGLTEFIYNGATISLIEKRINAFLGTKTMIKNDALFDIIFVIKYIIDII